MSKRLFIWILCGLGMPGIATTSGITIPLPDEVDTTAIVNATACSSVENNSRELITQDNGWRYKCWDPDGDLSFSWTRVNNVADVPTVADAAALTAVTCSSTVNTGELRLQLDTAVTYQCYDPGGGYVWTSVASAAATGVPGFTDCSVPFVSSGVLAEDNANLCWDDVNNRLGIGTVGSASILELSGNPPQLALSGGNPSIKASAGSLFLDVGTAYFRGTGGSNDGKLQVSAASISQVIAPPTTRGLIVEFETGIGTSTPDRNLEVLDNSGNPQFRLTYTDNADYCDFEVDSAGDLTITPTGGKVGIVGCITNGKLSSAPSGAACDRYYDTDVNEWCCHNGTNWFECDDNTTACV